MKVRTKVAMSGTINGQPWPERGGVIDLPDVVAVKMLASGQATHVAEPDEVETTTVDTEVETREVKNDTGHGEDPDEGGEEVDVLRAEAAELGLKVHHNAKAETIRRQIDEALLAEGTESS